MFLAKYIFSAIVGIVLFNSSLLYAQPNQFLSYDVQPGAGCTILIRWEVPAGTDTVNYILERSNDKKNWKMIAGERIRNSHKYIVFDTKPEDSLNYYRVKLDNNSPIPVYSPVKSIQLVRAFEIYLWPNPATDMLYVMTPFMSGTMDIFDSTGILVRKIIIVDFNNSISIIGLAA